MPIAPRSMWMNRLELLVLAAGVGLRAARFLEQRPLWLDEVLIALNVLSRTPLGLMRPLDHLQLSPVGFLWGEWAMTRVFGAGERALRLLPFIVSVIALMIFARVARRLLEPGLSLLATTLAALSPLLIYYSAEVKSYGLDWLGMILMMLVTLRLMDDPSRREWARWGLAATFASLVSTPAPFYITGCAISLLAARPFRERRAMLRLVIAGAPAAILFGLQFTTAYDAPRTTSFMELYWTEAFLQTGLRSILQAAHFARMFWSDVLFGSEIVDLLPPKTMTVILAVSALGAVAVAKRAPATLLMLLAPALFVAGASVLKMWPLSSRLLLFLAPAVFITLVAGMGLLVQPLPQRVRPPVLAALSVVLVAVAAFGLQRDQADDDRFAAVPDALREIRERAGQNATIYLSADLGPACSYYLAWHPDRASLGADASTRECSVRGRRTVIGTWPEFVGIEPGRATSAAKVVSPEWLRGEGERLLDPPAAETWVVMGNPPSLRRALLPWLESSGGMARVAERDQGTILIRQYAPRPDSAR